MRWVIANLFEAHQERQNNPFALDSIGPIEFRGQFFNGLLIERGLFTGELAEGLHLRLVRQIGNDRLIRLHAPQNVRTRQLAKRRVWVVRPVCETPGEACEFLAGTEQAGIDEVEDRPEVSEPILHRRASERDPCLRLELFDGPCLFCAWVLDGLGFVQNYEAPRNLQQSRGSQERSVAGDDEV